jgi:hypothetical protein
MKPRNIAKPLANTPKTLFLAFESYDASRSGAEAEATLVVIHYLFVHRREPV